MIGRLHTRLIVALGGILLAAFLAGCSEGPDDPEEAPTRSFDVAPSREDLAEIERAVLEAGHQPWRLDPASVARADLRSVLTEHYDHLISPELTEVLVDDDAWNVGNEGQDRAFLWHGPGIAATVIVRNTRPNDGGGVWYSHEIAVTVQVACPPAAS